MAKKSPEGFLADKEQGVYAVPDEVYPEPKPKPKPKPPAKTKRAPAGFLTDKSGVYAVPDEVPSKPYAKGGSVTRGDGCARRGRTKGKNV
jgi:hypothetical protein